MGLVDAYSNNGLIRESCYFVKNLLSLPLMTCCLIFLFGFENVRDKFLFTVSMHVHIYLTLHKCCFQTYRQSDLLLKWKVSLANENFTSEKWVLLFLKLSVQNFIFTIWYACFIFLSLSYWFICTSHQRYASKEGKP